MNTARRGTLHGREQGVALVVTLLFTGIVLLIIVSTSATLVTGARSGGADERRAYQALLNAESGLNTVAVRVKQRMTTSAYTGSSKTDLQTWLNGLNASAEAALFPTLTFTALDASHFTAEAQGSASGAVKVALQDFSISSTPITTSLKVRAALTSLPRIDANGSALIKGQSNRGPITTLTQAVTAAVGSSQVTVQVADSSGLLLGDYVQIPSGLTGQKFRVDGISGQQVTLSAVPTAVASVLTAIAGTEVELILNAAAQTTTSVTDPLVQRVSNAGDFTVGETVTISGQKAVITAVTSSSGGTSPNQLTLDWTTGQPASIPEGTDVIRDVSAMRSASTITVKSNTVSLNSFQMDGSNDCTAVDKVVTCEGANDPLLKSGSALEADKFFTQQMLGLTDEQLNELVPLTLPDASGKFPPMVNAIRRIRAQDFDAAVKNTTSSSVLIVDGDINSNVNGTTVFNGFIYFRGNQGGKFNGTMTVNGAIAVRGGPIEGLTTDDVATDITGNLTVNYNAVKLRQLMMNAQGIWQASETQGSWRQR